MYLKEEIIKHKRIDNSNVSLRRSSRLNIKKVTEDITSQIYIEKCPDGAFRLTTMQDNVETPYLYKNNYFTF